MQNKGLIKLFAVLFALVSIYQLSFTFIASNVETEAETFAESEIPESVENFTQERNNAAEQYLDSIGNESIFAGISYNTAKGKELNKGLDLKGGINVILQISVGDLLKGLANNSKDPAFNQALTDAGEARKNSQDSFLELFYQAFESNEGASLASPDIFGTKALSDEVSFDMENSSVKPISIGKLMKV